MSHSKKVICSMCGRDNPGHLAFCMECGHRLATRSAGPSPGSTPRPSAPEVKFAKRGEPRPPTPDPATLPVVEIQAPKIKPHLVLIARDGSEGATHLLGETTDIGRTHGNVRLPDDSYVSPRHARITRRGTAFFLRDLESLNGVYVRIPFQRPLDGDASTEKSGAAEQLLTDQDLFLVGQQVLRFEVVKHAVEGFGVASEEGTLLFGTPVSPRFARLTQRTVEGIGRDVYYLDKAETVLGRESCDIVFGDDAFLSRRHATVRVHGSQSPDAPRRYTLSDLGSSNGTFLQVRDDVRLRSGDQFRIGQQLFRFDS